MKIEIPGVLESVANLVGGTPLVHLRRFAEKHGLKHHILGKCEFLNPGGSVKDRIAFHMVLRAEESGTLQPGGTIVEATAGNTGIGLALVAAVRGYKLITFMSQKVSVDKVKLLQALGAETVITAGKNSSDPEHFMNRARAYAEENGAWLADQFNNKANVEIHYRTTGPEIWQQTAGRVDAVVAGVGTGGTLTGISRFLKQQNSAIHAVLADPDGSLLADFVRGTEGRSFSYLVEGIGQDFIPGNFDQELVDRCFQISDAQSIAISKELMQHEGLFVGSSSGCIVSAALEYAKTLPGQDKIIVAILPDGGRGYLSTIYDDSWLKQKLPM